MQGKCQIKLKLSHISNVVWISVGAKSLIPLPEFLLMPAGLILGIIFHIALFVYIAIIIEVGTDYEKVFLYHILIAIGILMTGILLFYFTGVAYNK